MSVGGEDVGYKIVRAERFFLGPGNGQLGEEVTDVLLDLGTGLTVSAAEINAALATPEATILKGTGVADDDTEVLNTGLDGTDATFRGSLFYGQTGDPFIDQDGVIYDGLGLPFINPAAGQMYAEDGGPIFVRGASPQETLWASNFGGPQFLETGNAASPGILSGPVIPMDVGNSNNILDGSGVPMSALIDESLVLAQGPSPFWRYRFYAANVDNPVTIDLASLTWDNGGVNNRATFTAVGDVLMIMMDLLNNLIFIEYVTAGVTFSSVP